MLLTHRPKKLLLHAHQWHRRRRTEARSDLVAYGGYSQSAVLLGRIHQWRMRQYNSRYRDVRGAGMLGEGIALLPASAMR
jgi:hypothetical protein